MTHYDIEVYSDRYEEQQKEMAFINAEEEKKEKLANIMNRLKSRTPQNHKIIIIKAS